jgi:alpha,alpha-trehalose phosphorylase
MPAASRRPPEAASRSYPAEPWCIREPRLNLDILPQSESVFALSNGHIGLRGNLDEGEPHGLPGTYLNTFCEFRQLPHAEPGYGYPASGQTIVNVTNGKLIRLLVDDEPFDVRYGTVHSHQRTLDLRQGILVRDLEWSTSAGSRLRITSTRLVSLTQRAIAAVEYTVEPVSGSMRVVAESELAANETLPTLGEDPRASTDAGSVLLPEGHIACHDDRHRVLLMHRARHSGMRLAAGMAHDIEGPAEMLVETEAFPDMGRCTTAARLAPGDRLRIVKYLGYAWSSQRSSATLEAQVRGALAVAQLDGWDGLLAEQQRYLNDFWASADVVVDGDPELQQAVRFALFHILQAGPRAACQPIPAKGLTGPGYDGHTFWDTETYVLPVLTYTQPDDAASVLRWRHSALPAARERAANLGLAGATFPWRTIRGEECSGYWPAGTAAFHINADISDAVRRYIDATGDTHFEQEIGVELLAETARLWLSLGYFDAQGQFRIDGVTGPDEYSALADNNVYTNLMAQQNLAAAADACARHPQRATRLGVTAEDISAWRRAAEAMMIPYDEQAGVHPQHEGFTRRQRWDFENTSPGKYPLFMHYPYFELYRKQVVKQADLVLAMYLRTDAFTAEQKARNFAYYESLTVRDSSLSASAQAVIAAETGHLDLAYDYLAETALTDLEDRHSNTRDGLHLASLAGTWTALVAGFGGMRAQAGTLAFSPRLPAGISRVAFRIRYRQRTVRVAVTPGEAKYELLEGEQLAVTHHGEPILLGHLPVILPIPALPLTLRPRQPPGRAPVPRRTISTREPGSPGSLREQLRFPRKEAPLTMIDAYAEWPDSSVPGLCVGALRRRSGRQARRNLFGAADGQTSASIPGLPGSPGRRPSGSCSCTARRPSPRRTAPARPSRYRRPRWHRSASGGRVQV